MSPTRHVWKPLRAKTRTAAFRISRRLSSLPFDRSVNLVSIVEPLAGILVVDLTRYIPGPFASRELLRLGARVVRLEAPDGDPLRDVSPEWDAALNGGKESVLWDRERDPDLGRTLCSRADVVLEAFRPGVAGPLTGELACYRIYRCADGRFLTVAALEPKFWRRLCELVARPDLVPRQNDAHAELEQLFETRQLAEWLDLFDGEDVAVGPVATWDEAKLMSVYTAITPATPPSLGEHTVTWRRELGLESPD